MEKECVLTIFTPAYNRAHTLSRTYQSLCGQTVKDFIWLIIDDGSTDNTRKNGKIEIMDFRLGTFTKKMAECIRHIM